MSSDEPWLWATNWRWSTARRCRPWDTSTWSRPSLECWKNPGLDVTCFQLPCLKILRFTKFLKKLSQLKNLKKIHLGSYAKNFVRPRRSNEIFFGRFTYDLFDLHFIGCKNLSFWILYGTKCFKWFGRYTKKFFFRTVEKTEVFSNISSRGEKFNVGQVTWVSMLVVFLLNHPSSSLLSKSDDFLLSIVIKISI